MVLRKRSNYINNYVKDNDLIFEAYVQITTEAIDPDELADKLSRGHGKRGERVARTYGTPHTGDVPQSGASPTSGVKIKGTRSKEQKEADDKREAERQKEIAATPPPPRPREQDPYNPIFMQQDLEYYSNPANFRRHEQEARKRNLARIEDEIERRSYREPVPKPVSPVKIINKPEDSESVSNLSQDELLTKMAEIQDEIKRRESQEEDESVAGYVNQSYQYSIDDDKLLWEAYVEEGRVRTSILALMCALGFGCSTTKQDPHRHENPPTEQEMDRLNLLKDIIDILGPILEDWINNSGVSEEQKLHLGASIKQQMERGTPEEGWENWLKVWIGRTSNSV